MFEKIGTVHSHLWRRALGQHRHEHEVLRLRVQAEERVMLHGERSVRCQRSRLCIYPLLI